MFDIKAIKENPDQFNSGMSRRGLLSPAPELLALDEARRAKMTQAQEVQARRNKLAKEIGQIKAKGGDAAAIMAEVAKDKELETQLTEDAGRLEEALRQKLMVIPNVPAQDVPEGKDESANQEVARWGAPKEFNFKPLSHDELGEKLKLMDFEAAARMSGARFVVLKGALARLERALAQFMLDVHTGEFGYMEVSPPILVKDEALFGTGQLPKFSEDLFKTVQGHWLIPTAEVSLTNLLMDQIVEEKLLPLRLTAMTPCFRSEAGSAGRDTKGMIRQHQFMKVELVSITTPEQSDAEHQRMTDCASEILKRLGLPFRTMLLCSGDMGFSARKTYDLEVWLPSQGCYREISSCSNCGDFQALRMKARYRPAGEKGTKSVHTLNGSGLAVGRALIAVLENYQLADGRIEVPEALCPYMGGLGVI